MSRTRRAAEAWPTREPEITESEPRWASLTDTGSLAPSEEALTWQRRADAWAQQDETEPYSSGSQAIEPANRWSDVASTGRPTFPADGVGWRTQTSEWQATGARWRQTTEWRSSTGSHVWRSTTEAWQSADDFTPEREKPAIAGTAWPTPAPESEQSNEASTPSWQQPSTQTPSWQRREPDDWQRREPDDWQRREPDEWQRPEPDAWQRRTPDETPSWRADDPSRATQPVEQTWSGAGQAATPSWQQRPADSWSRGAEQPSPGENTVGITRWERTEAPGWQTSPVEDARHLVREDDRAAWQRDAGYADQPPRRGRRRAPETDSTPSGGTGWSTASDSSDNWARHTDTGNIQAQPTWGARAEAPTRSGGRRSRRDDTSRQVETPTSYGEPTSAAPAGYPGSPAEAGGTARRGRPARYNANTTDWREDTASWEAEPDTSNWTRDPDTGQWSRAEDDPRVLAWRAEAARRESSKGDDSDPGGGRRSRRPELPSGGVPGGPLPSSGVPADPVSGAAWPASGVPADARIGVPSTRPRSAMPGAVRPNSAMPGTVRPNSATPGAAQPYSATPGAIQPDGAMPGSAPWSGAATPGTPGVGRRHRDDTYGAAEQPPSGRRRASDPQAPEAWQAVPEPRQSRQARRQNAEPEEYQTGGWRQGPLPPRQASGPRELPAGDSQWPDPYPSRELPAGGPSWADRDPRRPSRELPPGGPSWADQERQPPGSPSWSDQEGQPTGGPSWGGQSTRDARPSGPSWGGQDARQSTRDSAPGGPSWAGREPGRPNSGVPSWADREGRPATRGALPSGPSWGDPESRRPTHNGTPAGPGWADREATPGRSSWSDREPGPNGQPWSNREPGPNGQPWSDREPGPNGQSWSNREPGPNGQPWSDREPGPNGQPWSDREAARNGQPWTDREPGPNGQSWRDGEARSGGPSWGDREPRQPYRDPAPSREIPPGGASWNGQEPRRTGFGSARELPAGGSPRPASAVPSWSEQEPRRTGFGSARELPAGGSPRPASAPPSWAEREPRRPSYGAPRELPAGPAPQQAPGTPSWAEQEQRRPSYGGPRELPAGSQSAGPTWGSQPGGGQYGVSQWPDPLSQPRRASAPAYGASENAPNGYDDRDDPPTGGGYGQARVPGDWLAAERAARRGPQYRDGAGQDGETDWRQELSRDNALTEDEPRRYDTSDFPPFRPSGSATVAGASNLALSATSVISRVPEASVDAQEEDTSWPPRRTTGAFQGTGSYERRPVSDGMVAAGSSDLLNPDDEDEEETSGGPLAAVGYTVVWYGVPVVLFVLGMFLLNTGQRTHALDTLAGAAPEFGVALALSILVALCLRWATTAWKSASVGLAAAVVGGGLATVLSSAITGNSLS